MSLPYVVLPRVTNSLARILKAKNSDARGLTSACVTLAFGVSGETFVEGSGGDDGSTLFRIEYVLYRDDSLAGEKLIKNP